MIFYFGHTLEQEKQNKIKKNWLYEVKRRLKKKKVHLSLS